MTNQFVPSKQPETPQQPVARQGPIVQPVIVSLGMDPRLSMMGDTRALVLYDANKKSMGLAYVLWFFIGIFGAHRFYAGHTGSGVAMLIISLLSFPLLLLGGVGAFGFFVTGIWALVDLFLIPGMIRGQNNMLAYSLLPRQQ